LTYQPDGMPSTNFSCFRAKVTVPSNYLDEVQGVLALSLEIPALPFAESAEVRDIHVGGVASTLDTLDTTPTGWAADTKVKVEGSQSVVSFIFGPRNIDRLTFFQTQPKDLSAAAAMGVWVRRDSRVGQRITQTYTLILRDTAGHLFTVGTKSYPLLHGIFTRLTFPIKAWPIGFNPRLIAGYKLITSGPSWVDYLHSMPQAGELWIGTRGGMYELTGIEGSVRAPMRLELNPAVNNVFDSAMIHVPPPDAPDGFLPIVEFNHQADGTTRVKPPVHMGTQTGRRFHGTYAVYLALPAQAGTFTVNCYLKWNDPLGQVQGTIQETIAGSITASVTAGDFRAGIVGLGTFTLPTRDMPDENDLAGWEFTVGCSDPTVIVQDILLIDIRGSLVWTGPPQRFRKMFIDPPSSTVQLGGVYGGSDREHALSILNESVMTGEPLSVHPDTSRLFVYSTDGGLSITASYLPRWYSLDPGSQPVPSDVTDPYPTLYATTY
jgi:hypothetical protein